MSRKRLRSMQVSDLFDEEASVSGSDISEDEDLGEASSSLDLFIDDTHHPSSPSFYRSFSAPNSPGTIPDRSSLPVSVLPIIAPPNSSQRESPLPAAPEVSSAAQSSSSTAQFRLQSKHIFLTYPQCSYTPEDLLRNLQVRFENPNNHFLISREKHEDGSWHLHALLDLKEKFRTRRVDYFDDLVVPPKHPNIVSKLKSRPATIRYITKGGDPALIVSTFDYQSYLKKSASKRSTKGLLITEMINDGKTLDEIDDLHPDYVLLHGRILREYFHYKDLKKLRRSFAEAQQIPVRVWPAPDYLNVWNARIATWLSSNIRLPRPHRSAQLWIAAPAGSGKTSLIMWLEATFKLSVYYWPKDEHWWDGYSDKAFDLIVLDEFRSQKKITELNPILSGDPTPLSRRSAAPLVKRDNLPVIILSNFTPQECFHKCQPAQLAPLLDRLLIVAAPDNHKLRFIEEPDDPNLIQFHQE